MLGCCLVAAGAVPARGAHGGGHRAQAPIRFVDYKQRNLLRIRTPRYELSLSRATGAIVSLVERGSGARLVAGQGGCLWGARAQGGDDYIGGCAFSRSGPRRLSHRWDARSATLTLTYTNPAGVSATAVLAAKASSFDVQLKLQNRTPRLLSSVLFPADIAAAAGSVTAGYAPNFLPGVKLSPAFFTGERGNILTYPGRWAFADFLAVDLAGGHLALYSVNPDPNPLQPVELGFVRRPGTFCFGRLFCITHTFDTWIGAGQAWSSPVMRVRVGDPVEQTVAGYRSDNGIDDYPSLADKLGPDWQTYLQSPLIKADARKGLPPLAAWGDQLRRLPSPALLHPVRYQPGAFDENAPDFLPPDPAVGTSADLRAMAADAHALGLHVMPYLNVSWWNVSSPTVRTLSAQTPPTQFAVVDAGGNPRLETYKPFTGYVVSPYAAPVRQRVAALMDQWQTDAPMDCYFFDQIGARPWIRDFNSAAPSPLAYYDGWLSLMAPFSGRCLMVEDGWDRLAKSFAGFHGGLLVVQRESAEADYLFGAGRWQAYPLAPMLFHGKALLYQHDLSEQTMTENDETLTFNVAYGFMLSYGWDGTANTLDRPWLDAVGSYQRALGPYYAADPVESFASPAPNVTETTFSKLSVVANWSATGAYATSGYGVAPSGFLARARDDAVVAGVFAGTFDGWALKPGTHHLITTRTASAVTVQQPIGDATELGVRLPASWRAGDAVTAVELRPDGKPAGTLAGSVRDGRFVFTCAGPGPDGRAPTYRISVG